MWMSSKDRIIIIQKRVLMMIEEEGHLLRVVGLKMITALKTLVLVFSICRKS